MGVAWLGDTPQEAVTAPYTDFISTYLLYTEAHDPACFAYILFSEVARI